MTHLLFFGVSLAIFKTGSLDSSHYFAVPVSLKVKINCDDRNEQAEGPFGLYTRRIDEVKHDAAVDLDLIFLGLRVYAYQA
jgi:hypothetical protein